MMMVQIRTEAFVLVDVAVLLQAAVTEGCENESAEHRKRTRNICDPTRRRERAMRKASSTK